MAAFICDRCGKCCVSLGQSITIERQLNDRDYYCRSKIDNAIFIARVDPAYREEIADEFAEGKTPQAGADKEPCRFLRKAPDGQGSCCVIYATRPDVCRTFRCYRMIVRNREGAICGKVIGKNTLRTEDPVLETIWNGEVLPVPCFDASAWARQVATVLAGHGYSAETVE